MVATKIWLFFRSKLNPDTDERGMGKGRQGKGRGEVGADEGKIGVLGRGERG